MRRAKMFLTAFLIGVLCWTPVMQPFAAYAQIALAESSASGSNDDNVDSQQDGETLPDAGVSEGEGEQGLAPEPGTGAVGQPDAEGVDAESDDALQSTQDDATTPEVDDAADEAAVDNTANGFLENSWRYENGVLRADLEPSDRSLYSRDVRPEGATAWGIDVSNHQGSIDWAKVKAAGVDYAILRCGYGEGIMDDSFIRNVQGCKKYGIPFGVYLYCYAWDAKSAREEAEGTLSILSRAGVKPSDLAFPVYYDIENTVGNKNHPDYGKPAGVDGNNQYHVIRNNATFTAMAETYCNIIQNAGFEPGVYASLNWWRNYLNDAKFNSWDRWVAQYYSECTYEGTYSMWQYSSSGRVDGIRGNVDVNWYFEGEKRLNEYKDVFDPEYYFTRYPDIRDQFGGNKWLALKDFIEKGMAEGRRGCESFDVSSYYNANLDLREAYRLNLKRYYEHYIKYGKKEGRVSTGVPKITTYRSRSGATEYSAVYDGAYYRAQYSDLDSHFTKRIGEVVLFDDGGLLDHFVRNGMREGRRASESFDVLSYYNEYPDLRREYGLYYPKYYEHYIKYGKDEGRHGTGCTNIIGYRGFQNPSQYYQVSSLSVPIPHQGSGIFGYRTPSKISDTASRNDCVNALITTAYDYMGTRYVWNYACAPGVGVDCAGLVMQCLYATGMKLSPMTPWDHFNTPGHDQYANYMWDHGRFLRLGFDKRRTGDLVCYDGHIAIYIGNDRIIEAFPRRGVIVSNVYSNPGIKGVLRPFV